MRYSRYFIHTLFEVPKEAEIPSHILLLRGSYIHPVAAGIYSLLPLGHRVAEKVKNIMRDELNAIGGMEVTLPVLNPAELWKKTRRYFDIGPELFRIKDRKEREFVLAMTHEEVITDIAKQFLTSYRDMPVMLYQIHTKIRDEARPRAGLLRVREFFMKDGYSFHTHFDDLDAYYPKIFNAYLRIFARCGLKAVPIEADSGIMGGTGSHEFMLDSPHGEDRFVVCTQCRYRANTEKAAGLKPMVEDVPDNPPAMEVVDTPNIRTITALMEFFGISDEHFLKTVAYEADGELVLAVIRGDFAVSGTKLTNHLKAVHLDLAPEGLLLEKGLHPGFLSPVGLKNIRIVMDNSVSAGAQFVAGANQLDKHLKNVLYGRDFTVREITDIAEVREGDGCAQCRRGQLEIRRGIELGHTFKLGTKYTAADTMDVTFLNAQGEQNRVIMGCYGIGVERLMASAAEQWHDDCGIVWPISLAPFQVIVTAIGNKLEVLDNSEKIYSRLNATYEVLYDDRNDSPGVKLKDADLLGIPVRVVISQKLLKNDQLEIKNRKTGEITICSKDRLDETIAGIIEELQPTCEGLPYLAE
ncbi:proline--tRNA ligase [Desulfoferrobacter suflitae]|uniref:proline--tRNA ligase n=1 Tax=Desulfoferrobacter suflitae TaxID=2865782 RepID=UPI002164756A|nr:proline--tRNA ligase [Desulfoferrobacter suflitae]MCK8601894.1 proline--tRNA ligase [Desulfoferrobacter suflitae]